MTEPVSWIVRLSGFSMTPLPVRFLMASVGDTGVFAYVEPQPPEQPDPGDTIPDDANDDANTELEDAE